MPRRLLLALLEFNFTPSQNPHQLPLCQLHVQTPATQKQAHQQPPRHANPNDGRRNDIHQSTPALPPASVTPGPASTQKVNRPTPIAPNPTGQDAAAAFSTFEGANERILPAGKANFEDNHVEFRRRIADLEDAHQRGDRKFLDMQVEFEISHAETLQDQGELSMLLGSVFELVADLDLQINEYDEFLGSST